MKLTIRKSEWIDDWWVIERAEHEGTQKLVPVEPNVLMLDCSSRFSDADVEGTGSEMRELAQAIKDRAYFSERRCAVEVKGEKVDFWSPRNSQRRGVVSYAEADALADEIFATIPEAGA